MGVFHKTLDDVEKEYHKRNYKKALAIVEQHINNEHSVRGAFAIVNEMFVRFSSQLEFIEGNLKSIISNDHTVHHEGFENSLKEAKNVLRELLEHTKDFYDLCEDEK